MLNHRVSRDENEFVLRMLCDHFPKCFFEKAKLRKPLKKDIAIDLINDKNFDVEPERIHAAVDWYKSHLGYHIACSTAGAKRVDLNGKEVGTISESEAIAEQREVKEIQKTMAEQQQQQRDPVEVVSKLYAGGRMTDDGVKKLDATPIPKSKPAPIALEFTQLYETFVNANAAVNGINDPVMRLAVAKATLDEVIRRAQQVKDELAK